MGFSQKLKSAIEFGRLSEMIDTQVTQFRKETQDMRQEQDKQRSQRIIKFKRETKWVAEK